MLSSHSRGQLCSSLGLAKIAKSLECSACPGILVGQVPTPKASDNDHRARDLARALLGPSWPRVRRIPLIRREVRESLSDSALEILFAEAELLVEGDHELGARDLACGRVYATVMLTVDLSRSAALLRERPDEATAERVAELMRGSPGVRRRVSELARPRLAELFGADPRSLRIELLPSVRTSGVRILIDGDAVVSVRDNRVAQPLAKQGVG